MRAHYEYDFVRGLDVLYLIQEGHDGYRNVLCEDGLWRTAPMHAAVEGAGFPLPRGAWQAICDIAVPSHGAAEVKRLEEALAVERARVDSVLQTLTGRQH